MDEYSQILNVGQRSFSETVFVPKVREFAV